MFSDDTEAFKRTGEPLSRGEQFHFETLRLWQIEEGRTSLVNLQAVIVLMIESVILAVRTSRDLTLEQGQYAREGQAGSTPITNRGPNE